MNMPRRTWERWADEYTELCVEFHMPIPTNDEVAVLVDRYYDDGYTPREAVRLERGSN